MIKNQISTQKKAQTKFATRFRCVPAILPHKLCGILVMSHNMMFCVCFKNITPHRIWEFLQLCKHTKSTFYPEHTHIVAHLEQFEPLNNTFESINCCGKFFKVYMSQKYWVFAHHFSFLSRRFCFRLHEKKIVSENRYFCNIL